MARPSEADSPAADAPEVSPHEDRILRALRQITRATDLHSRRLAQAHQLTSPQLVCLRQLRTDGELTPSVLARKVSLSQATVTGILDRLAARSLLTRVRSQHDRRRVKLALTAEGERVADSAPSALHERFAARLAALPPDGQARIADVLDQIVEMMVDDPGGQGGGRGRSVRG